MVESQIAGRGVRDPAVLRAMRRVPREAFIPDDLAEFAYRDGPLPIAEDQTISQPYIVALMAEALEFDPDDRVLEIGTGSGYAAAILAEIVAEVYTVERHAALAEWAQERLEAAGYGNVAVRHGDGTKGWAEHAPYDAIVAAAGGAPASRRGPDVDARGGLNPGVRGLTNAWRRRPPRRRPRRRRRARRRRGRRAGGPGRGAG